MRARAVVFSAVQQAEVRQIEVPDPQAGELLVEVRYSAVSPGTEMRCFRGTQHGAPPYPFIPGYSASGHVVAAGPQTRIPVGTAVHCSGTARADVNLCWGGHASYVVVSEDRVFALPDGFDLKVAATGRLMGIAARGARLANPVPSETVAVVGLGPIGQLSARMFAARGAEVVGFDPVSDRTKVLAPLKSKVVEGDLVAATREVWPEGADIVVDATGSAAVLPQSLLCVKRPSWQNPSLAGSRLVVQGSYAGSFTLDYNEAFQREIHILLPRDTTAEDIRWSIEQVHAGKLDIAPLITLTASPLQADEVYQDFLAGRPDLITAVFDWSLGA